MQKTKLTVFFEDPFWVGVFERLSDGRLSVCKITFGPEPRDAEIYELVLESYNKLVFGPPIATDERPKPLPGYKRALREAKAAVREQGVGTRSMRAMSAAYEQTKTERRQKSKAEREEAEHLRFLLRRQKQKEKHRGR